MDIDMESVSEGDPHTFYAGLRSAKGSVWSMYSMPQQSNLNTRSPFSLASLSILVPVVMCNATVVFAEWSICTEHREWSSHVAGLYLTSFSLGYILTALMVNRFDIDCFVAIATGVIGCGAILMSFIFASDGWHYIVLLICLGFFTALVEAHFSAALRYIGYDKHAAMELTEITVRIASIISGLLGGMFLFFFDFDSAYRYFAMILAIGAPTVFCVT